MPACTLPPTYWPRFGLKTGLDILSFDPPARSEIFIGVRLGHHEIARLVFYKRSKFLMLNKRPEFVKALVRPINFFPVL